MPASVRPRFRRRQRPRFPPAVFVLFAVTAIALVAWMPRWLDPAVADAPAELWALNAFPLLLLFAALWALVRRPATAAAIVAIVAALFHSAHQQKLQLLELPLMPADLAMVAHTGLLHRYVEINPLYALLPVAMLLLWRYEPVPRRRHGSVRAVAFASAFALLAGMPLGWPPWPALYDQQRLGIEVWIPATAAERIGAGAYFVHLAQSTWQGPQPPDPVAAAEFDARFGQARTERLEQPLPDELPDLIVVQSESFFDPGRLNGIDAASFVPNLRRLAAAHLGGDLVVPTYGGLTTRTEFELLTGVPMRSMPSVQYPYDGLVHRPVHGLPWALKSIGYTTRAVHPYERRFYRRNRVYPLLGFDSFHSISEFDDAARHGYYVSDAALNERIIELVDAGSPLFLFALSMENHGPWDQERPLPAAELEAIDVPAALDQEAAHALRAFLHHTRRADAALGELADWVLARERPTVLLFFGDHLPGLHAVYDTLGFVDGRHATAQPVPWLLVHNRHARAERHTLAAHELAPVLLEVAGVNRDPHFIARSLVLYARPGLAAADEAALVEHIARASYASAVDRPLARRDPGDIAAVRDWGPRSLESIAAGDAAGSFWVEFEQPPPRGTFLRLGDHRLDVSRPGERRLHGVPSTHVASRLLGAPGTIALKAIDPTAAIEQVVGSVHVRPRAERMVQEDGRRLRNLCAVEAWGPDASPRDGSANPQPGGGLGLWVRAACLPASARLDVAGILLDTVIQDRVATATIPLDLLARTPKPAIRLVDPDSAEALEVGVLSVLD
jgi:hypothetical protein